MPNEGTTFNNKYKKGDLEKPKLYNDISNKNQKGVFVCDILVPGD